MSVTERDILHTTLRELFAKNKRLRELEATLQAKDAQIEALEAMAWELVLTVVEDPRVDTHTTAQVAAMDAIKEATNGS